MLNSKTDPVELCVVQTDESDIKNSGKAQPRTKMSPRVAASTSGDLEAPKESDPLLLGLAQLHTTEGRDDALESRLSRARRLLYISHFFNQFSGISWQFCLVLFLAAFSNYESLILVSSYGLLSSGAVCYFGTAAGRFIDGTNRLFVARSFIGLENFAVLSATLCCYVLLNRANLNQDTEFEGIPSDPFSVFLLVGVLVLDLLELGEQALLAKDIAEDLADQHRSF